jgi:serine/threonine-protein kinase
MKKYLEKPLVRKILFIFLGIIILLLILDKVILPWYVSEPERAVPNVIGMKEFEAISQLEDEDFEPIISDTTYDQKFPKGSVILQKPEAGRIVKQGRRVYLFISGGEPVVYVPMLKGKSIRDAKFSLERIGLKLGEIEEVPSSNPRNMIFDQQYAEGTPLKKGATVNISVSTGEEFGEITVPDLIGKSLSEAEKVLADSSLKVGKINYQRSFSLLPNTILDQYPSKGNKVNEGAVVDLFVTKAAEPGTEETEIEEQ